MAGVPYRLEEMWRRATPVLLTDEAWELTTLNGQHIVRVFIGDQWWALRLHDANGLGPERKPSRRSRPAKLPPEIFAVSEADVHEGCIENRPSRNLRPYEIECKTVAWLPRKRTEDLLDRKLRRASCPTRAIRNQNIEEIDIRTCAGRFA